MKFFIPSGGTNIQKVANDISASYSGYHSVTLMGNKIRTQINVLLFIEVILTSGKNGDKIIIHWNVTGLGWMLIFVAFFSGILPGVIAWIVCSQMAEPKIKDMHKIITIGQPLGQTAGINVSTGTPFLQQAKSQAELINEARVLEEARNFEEAALVYEKLGLVAEASRVRKNHLEQEKTTVVNIGRVGNTILHDSVLVTDSAESSNQFPASSLKGNLDGEGFEWLNWPNGSNDMWYRTTPSLDWILYQE
jgi:hypothetical protein